MEANGSSLKNLRQDIQRALQKHDAVLRLSYREIVSGINRLFRQGIPKEVISQVVTQVIEAVSKDFNPLTYPGFYSRIETQPDAFTTEEASLCEPSHTIGPPAPAASAVEEPAFTAENSSVATVPEGGEMSASGENLNVSVSVNDLIPCLPGLEAKQNERGLCLESIACPSNSAAQLIAEMKRNPAAVSPIPRLHPMPPRAGNEPSSATKGNQMSALENRAIMLETMNWIQRGSRRAWIRALLRSLEAWRTLSDAVSLPAISSAAWSRVSAAVLRRIRKPNYPAKVLQRWIFEFKRDWNSMINAIAFPEIKKSFLRWLRQPIHSNLWRQAKASPFEARRDLHQ
jgi:hypothetical protein